MSTKVQTSPQIRAVEVGAVKRQRRAFRRPRHSFALKAKPYEIVPFVIAPVLPGETMDSFLMQSRVVTDPIKNPLIGWHQEYYWFYIKHRALAAWDTTGILQAMMLNPATDVSTLKAAANSTPYFTFKSGMDYVKACTELVVDLFFRDENETYSGSATVENYYAAQVDQEAWWHSLKLESAGSDDTELPGVDELEETDILTGFTTQYAQWELMRDAGMTDLTYEDFLRSYGVSVSSEADLGVTKGVEEVHLPELIRFERSWAYPANTIDPATGSPSSAVFWTPSVKADKKRFFKEPGFLFGVTVTRPKLYMGSQQGAAVGMLDDAYAWLPAVLEGYPYVSVREELDSATDGILQNQTEDYWLDIKDLFLHGDQFLNYAVEHALALPTSTMQKKYPTETMIDSLFVTAGSEYVRQDGIMFFNILSRIGQDTTP